MTLNQLLELIEQQGIALRGEAGAAAEVLAALTVGIDGETVLARAEAIASLASLRRRYMGDDAPVEGFRLVERVVLAIDHGFNEEALRQR